MTAISTDTNQILQTGKDLSQCITQHIQELAEATDAALMSEEMVRYLETCARFHQYSIYNIWCILMARPDATRVAGYQTWRSLNRYVRKGEHGIPILAPILISENPDDADSHKVLRGFKVVYVFDVSQTAGEPLPEVPSWKSPEQNQILFDRLVEFAHSKGITVRVKSQMHEVQGVSLGGVIEIDPSAGTKTLIHEIAHELMHRDADAPIDPSIRELEAEVRCLHCCQTLRSGKLEQPELYCFTRGKFNDDYGFPGEDPKNFNRDY